VAAHTIGFARSHPAACTRRRKQNTGYCRACHTWEGGTTRQTRDTDKARLGHGT